MRAITPDTLPSAVVDTGYLLGKLVAGARKAQGYSQRALSEELGLGRSTLVEIEHGSPKVQLAHWLVVLDRLGLLDQLARNIGAADIGRIADAVPRRRQAR